MSEPTQYLRFANEFVASILGGTKTLTARYAFERPLTAGDRVQLRDEDDSQFATATIEAVSEMTVEEFVAADFDGHQSYETSAQFLDVLRQYYPDGDFTRETVVTVIHFSNVQPVPQ